MQPLTANKHLARSLAWAEDACLEANPCSALTGSLTCCSVQGGQSYKDPNIAAHHFHGHYGNPGTNNVPCDPPPPTGVNCYRGDNIFADLPPGQCNEYQYDISPVTAPGTFW